MTRLASSLPKGTANDDEAEARAYGNRATDSAEIIFPESVWTEAGYGPTLLPHYREHVQDALDRVKGI